MAKHNPRILYVDGFAGPGEYSGGELGSPLIALQVAANHILRERVLTGELLFIFIEKDPGRFANMSERVHSQRWPANFRTHPVPGAFAEVFEDVLSRLEERGRSLAPAFIFVDPFGPEGFPMRLLHRLLQNPRCELLVNFNYIDLNHWYLSNASRHRVCDDLFGTDKWRNFLSLPTREQEQAVADLYQEQLKCADTHTRPFRMVNRHNQTQYYLVFATKHPLGLRLMKDAMWAVDPTGSFTFSDMSNPYQPRLLDDALTGIFVSEVAEELLSAFRGQKVSKTRLNEWADIHPSCRQTHLTQALRQLEQKGLIAVVNPSGRRRGFTYPANVEVNFPT